MQATSSTYRPPTGGDWLTTSSLILIVILAVITLAAIIYGMRLSAQRRAARRAEEQRVAADAVPDAAPEPIASAVGETARPEETRPAPAADLLPITPELVDEPIAATAPVAASPAVGAEPAPAADVRRPVDDRPLTILKGLGPKVATWLDGFGLRTIGDLAALDDAQAESIDARMGPFTGRMARDRWLEQARLLAAGDVATFEVQFGRLDAPRG